MLPRRQSRMTPRTHLQRETLLRNRAPYQPARLIRRRQHPIQAGWQRAQRSGHDSRSARCTDPTGRRIACRRSGQCIEREPGGGGETFGRSRRQWQGRRQQRYQRCHRTQSSMPRSASDQTCVADRLSRYSQSGDQSQGDASQQGQSAAPAQVNFANHTIAAVDHAQNAGVAAPLQTAPTPAGVTAHTAKTAETASPATIALPQAVPVINTAKLIQSMGQSEMRVGMRSTDFGNISISTSATRDLISAQISLDHGELARTLAAHLPEMQARLGGNQAMDVRIDMNGQATGQGSGNVAPVCQTGRRTDHAAIGSKRAAGRRASRPRVLPGRGVRSPQRGCRRAREARRPPRHQGLGRFRHITHLGETIMHTVSANYTLPTVLNTLQPAATSGIKKAISGKATAAPTTGTTPAAARPAA